VTKEIGKLALLWRGDREARATATVENNRYHRIFEALAARGIRAEPAVYSEDVEDEVHAQLLQADGVLVWVNPISDGQNRNRLDAMLREVASHGEWVSAHPDVILKMGIKEVLYQTKHLGWGADTQLYRSTKAFHSEFPSRLQAEGSRVLKRNRGNGGQGTWKVEYLPAPAPDGMVRVLEARRGSVPEDILLKEFMARCEDYFGNDGCVIDQPFQRLRTMMESEWTPRMMELLSLNREALPLIWDADFLYGPRTAAGEDTYVLCEINVSCVFPIPDQAPPEIARLAEARLQSCRHTN